MHPDNTLTATEVHAGTGNNKWVPCLRQLGSSSRPANMLAALLGHPNIQAHLSMVQNTIVTVGIGALGMQPGESGTSPAAGASK